MALDKLAVCAMTWTFNINDFIQEGIFGAHGNDVVYRRTRFAFLRTTYVLGLGQPSMSPNQRDR
jgi:hypothetical protein